MRKKYTIVYIMVMYSAVLLGVGASCSSDSEDPRKERHTLEINSVPSMDGWVESDGSAHSDSGGPFTGDYEHTKPGVGHRQFYSFSFSAIPDGALIVSASLELYQVNVWGSPFTDLGNVVVDHLDYGATLDGADYDATALTANIGTLSDNATEEYKSLDVTLYVQADCTAARDYSQYRVRFSLQDNDDDGARDSVSFTDAEDSCCGTGNLPKLVVEYE
jgi:hypothetical protein